MLQEASKPAQPSAVSMSIWAAWRQGSPWAALLLLCLAMTFAATVSASQSTNPPGQSTDPSGQSTAQESQATGPPDQSDPPQEESKSSYEDPGVMGGPQAVGGQLVQDDERKSALFDVSFLPGGLYGAKRRLKQRTGIELSVDYNFVNQYASYSSTDRQAASGIFRVYGQWSPPGDGSPRNRGLVFRFENRTVVGSGIPPRELGFDTGSALSTATFKSFSWGVTSLYWEQAFGDRRFGFAAGHMDPGDFEDVHPLLTAYTAFMNDASFNNPTTALPQQGLGIVARAFLTDHVYLTGGLHDANGTPSRIDFQSFFQAREYFTWVEVGWAPEVTLIRSGEGLHVTLWHAEARKEAEVPESSGVAFSAARKVGKRWLPFVRAGYSPREDSPNAAILLSGMISAGVGIDMRTSDMLGLAVTWGRPPAHAARDQLSGEAFYRLQLTHNLQISPAVQWTLHPATNLERDFIWVATALRLRLVL